LRFTATCTVPLVAALVFPPTAFAARDSGPGDAKVISDATGGRLKATKGRYFDKSCNESVDYDAEVIDLNGDGQPEVFTNLYGTCVGGSAGVHMDLYIKNKSGQWKAQFGFPGQHNVLNTKSKGFPDIEIGGPGTCFPIWRWNGEQYDAYKRCQS
jgi:hypothetical protein